MMGSISQIQYKFLKSCKRAERAVDWDRPNLESGSRCLFLLAVAASAKEEKIITAVVVNEEF